MPVAASSPTPSTLPPASTPTPIPPCSTAIAPAPSTTVKVTPVPPAPSGAPAVTPPAESKPHASIPARVRRELEHERYQESWDDTRRNPRALRDETRENSHRHYHFRRWIMPLWCPCWLPVLQRPPDALYTKICTRPADHTCFGPHYTQHRVRRQKVASRRRLATLDEQGARRSTAGWYLYTRAGVADSRERNRCKVDLHVET